MRFLWNAQRNFSTLRVMNWQTSPAVVEGVVVLIGLASWGLAEFCFPVIVQVWRFIESLGF